MNIVQRGILAIGALAALIASLYVPWLCTAKVQEAADVTRSAGYNWVWHEPDVPYDRFPDLARRFHVAPVDGSLDLSGIRPILWEMRIDKSRIEIEWGAIVLVVAGLTLAAGGRWRGKGDPRA